MALAVPIYIATVCISKGGHTVIQHPIGIGICKELRSMEYHEELNISGISSHNGLVASSRFRIWQCQPTVSKEDITETK
jgi:hypothetical protein